ncbi:ABC transporter permease [Chelatococcus asaccharovorans]|uniref:Peptide/nickel transport system permease protein n=1 Tax=Chelatococcus asaccharovorans TaxID=28210 RepID=A0A2V3TXS0_9HYPH|nr:ABC transporter permease [Chelatococcus asaccharovorans]MBS7706792.1 ABC transporter permease [Chelatococcus asaccharovorans]PXW54062.1 peptide/nickel transport system permease protein [Chelatococcus asaccharovorans]
MGRIALELLLRRIILAIPILICVSALIFILLRLVPADPVAMSLPPGSSQADYEAMKQALGLDRSIPEQYWIWISSLLRGDFGTSVFFRRPVIDLVATALPATVELVVFSLIVGTLLGIGGGMLMFAWRGTIGEQVLDLGTTAIMAVPEFLWAILLILFLGVAVPLLPFIGRLDPSVSLPPSVTGFLLLDSIMTGRPDVLGSALTHMVLPVIALSIGLAPLIMRVLRSSLIETIMEDYITQARLRGISERQIILHHALKNAALPTISLIGVQGGFMFGGTVLVEMIFAYPGLGNLMVDAVRNHDLPVVQVVGLVYCVLVLAINAIVDVIYLAANPKLRMA